ncbi:MAG: type II toxin-antitoxin system RelB/DinJ family antitoxin [Candidatus Enteromonas sp.]|nr:type II toxin-antitoxin system RelB/DinJ family antitoxin [Candidatus Enteromonas sp.]
MKETISILIDSDIKKEATFILRQYGLDISSAVNLFLRQCVLRGGLPFDVTLPSYKRKTLAAMEEAKKISKDPFAKRYISIEELNDALSK